MCHTPSHGSDHLWLIWKESIQNCRCYRTDTAGGTDGRTDRRTEWNQYTPQQLHCSGGHNQSWDSADCYWKSISTGKADQAWESHNEFAQQTWGQSDTRFKSYCNSSFLCQCQSATWYRNHSASYSTQCTMPLMHGIIFLWNYISVLISSYFKLDIIDW